MNDFTGLGVFKSNNLSIKLYRLSIIEYGLMHFGSNFACERLNSTLAQSLRVYCSKEQENWSRILPSVMMAFRMSPY
jgi:hypothetical protein